MNPFRAKRIADHFANVGIFEINNRLHGVEVNYRGNRVYLEDENALWTLLAYIAHGAHYESLIAEAEAKLIA